MNAQHPPIDDSCQVEVVENLTAALPDICIAILPLTFIIEPIDLCDLSTLVIASKQCDARRMSRFQRHK